MAEARAGPLRATLFSSWFSFYSRSDPSRVFSVHRVAGFSGFRLSLFVGSRVRKADDAQALWRGDVVPIIEMGILFLNEAVQHRWRERVMLFVNKPQSEIHRSIRR
jgi:hypothetical protein